MSNGHLCKVEYHDGKYGDKEHIWITSPRTNKRLKIYFDYFDHLPDRVMWKIRRYTRVEHSFDYFRGNVRFTVDELNGILTVSQMMEGKTNA